MAEIVPGPQDSESGRTVRGASCPLSDRQTSLWFLEELEAGTPAYLVPLVLRIRGKFDAGRTREALALLVGRHEALRLCFDDTAETLCQRAADPFEPELPVEDVPVGPAREKALLEALRIETSTPLDLKSGRLLRARLFRTRPEEHFLALTLHHIAADGWSAGILASDFAGIYGALGGGSPLLPRPAARFLDFVLWERARFEAGRLNALGEFWAEHLRGAPRVLDLRTDFPRPKAFRFAGARFGKRLSPSLSVEAARLARREDVTAAVLLASNFAVLLHQCSGAVDLLTGFPYANRVLREWEPVVGFFANMAVRRSDLSGDPSFREIVGRHGEEARKCIDWLDMPLAKLVEKEGPERDLSRQPLFQHSFSMQNLRVPAVVLPGLDLQIILADNGTAKFDLQLTATETPRGLMLGLQYSTDLYREETARRLADQYERLLAAVVGNPDLRLSELPRLAC